MTAKTLALLLAAAAALSACNTIAGAGEDVSAAGSAVTNSADNVQQKM
ncbi:entericidin A/B family lipoprotein [Amaricoccus solimangrovi]|uniref:Entericidin A/B family lipoprotein n=1 Tax=Amaricoccus solimangrovi TaxID=2589815 RepID=A0A501WW73_9RHOB|nr:entericidin A/B family lipoprotein [Amaricoccus solimangrovi]TPE52690.1 entericidin A/B family lipoprotein [Amaricoccus solimangrovi]